MTPSKKPFQLPTLSQAMTEMLGSLAVFDPQEPHGLKLTWTPSAPDCKTMLVYGDNAAGKSLFRRILGMYYTNYLSSHKKTFESLHVSMATRTAGGMRGSFMYGPASDANNSSGAVSLSPLNGLFCTASGRDFATMVALDEAEVGLSTSFHFPMGQYIAQRFKGDLEAKPLHVGTLLVTHSTELAKGFIEELGHTPHVVAMGNYKDLSLQRWLDGQVIRRNVEDLRNLQEVNRTRHKELSEFFSKD